MSEVESANEVGLEETRAALDKAFGMELCEELYLQGKCLVDEVRALRLEVERLRAEDVAVVELEALKRDWVFARFPVPHAGCVIRLPAEVRDYIAGLRGAVEFYADEDRYDEGTGGSVARAALPDEQAKP